MRLVVAYDIVDDRRRTRFAKRLKDYVQRVQYSVFEGDTSERGELGIVRAIHEEIDMGEDSVRIYYLCKACAQSTRVFGVSSIVLREGDEVL